MASEKKKASKTLYYILFILYCAVMLWLLFDRKQYQFSDNHEEIWDYLVNLHPFKTIRGYLYVLQNREEAYLLGNAAINLVGNILIFIPYGIFLPYLFKRMRSFWKTILFGLLTVVCVELLQLVTLRGSCDIDDLILNMIGVLTGYVAYRVTYLKRE